MTQDNIMSQPQSGTAKELWTAYERQHEEELRLRDRWWTVHAELEECRTRERYAWELYSSAGVRRAALFDEAFGATYGERPSGG